MSRLTEGDAEGIRLHVRLEPEHNQHGTTYIESVCSMTRWFSEGFQLKVAGGCFRKEA